MSGNAPAKPADVPRPTRGESQTELVWRQFRRRKLAVASAVLILVLFTISVFAPFLANGMPIYYVGINRFEYQEALRTLRALVDQIGKDPAPASKLATISRQVGIMSRELSADKQQELGAISKRITELAASLAGDEAQKKESLAELAKFRVTLRKDFDPKNVTLASRPRWPVFASLGWGDIAFMVFNILLLLFPLWARLINLVVRRDLSSLSTQLKTALLIGLPLLSGLAWWLSVPARIDRTNYKSGVLVTAAAHRPTERAAEVVYDKVVWPLIPYSLDEENLSQQKRPPSAEHWMGTDDIGRDIMARMVWGGRVSLAVGVVSVSIYVTIGVIIGAIAGYFRGVWDLVISRIIEVVICFPSFFLILTIVAFLGPGIFNIMIVIGLIGWTGVAQLVRGEFLRLGEQEFIIAGRALGFSPLRIIFRHVLPNALAPVLVSATFGIAGAILTESGLSFLGFGITVPKPSWGGILSSGRNVIIEAPWLIYFPGLAIFLTITAYNLVGEALRDAADPRLRGGR